MGRTGWLVVAGALAAVAVACSGGEGLRGTVLEPSKPAPDFDLTNQHGEPVELAGRLGSVIVLPFLYINCPDICPVIASHLRQTHRLLGEDAAKVEIVAITVDPERDSVEAAYEYSEKWQMLGNWDYLVGDESQLRPIWQAYYVASAADLRHTDEGGASEKVGTSSTEALARDIVTAYTVSHSGPVYLIGRGGDLRSLFTLPFDPEDVVYDLRLLIAEGG